MRAIRGGPRAQLRSLDRPDSAGDRPADPPRTVILGVAASDAHAVANHFIAYHLRCQGFEVVNLGVCTPIAEFCEALRRHPRAEAVIIGSLNGHAYEDLKELRAARERGLVRCPVILGGNLSVGSLKQDSDHERLYRIGVDHILDDPADLVALLDSLRASVPLASAAG